MKPEPSASTSTPMDAAIKAMLDRRAGRGEIAGLGDLILADTVSAPQVRARRLRLRFALSRGWVRAMAVGLLAVLLIGTGLAGAGLFTKPAPAPTLSVPGFIRPFEYVPLTDPTFRPTAEPRPELVAWAAGPILPTPSDGGDPSGLNPDWSDARGVVIASGMAAWSHDPSARFMFRTPPAEFLADLRDLAHAPMGEIVETTLDGRPALSVMLLGTGAADIHVTGPIDGLSQEYVLMNLPSRLTVLEIDRSTVFILSWARTTKDLKAWLPSADGFVSTFHFLPEVAPS